MEIMLSDDVAGFCVTRSGQKAEFFATLDCLGAAGGSELVEGAGTVSLDGVFRDEEFRGDLTVAETAGDQGEDLELACRDAEGLLAVGIGSEGDGSFRGDKHFSDHDGFADDFATARDAEAEPDAEGREENGDKRTVELDGVLNDDEAVFGVLEDGDEEAADETEDDDVALHRFERVQAMIIFACATDFIMAYRAFWRYLAFASRSCSISSCLRMRGAPSWWATRAMCARCSTVSIFWKASRRVSP